jgi:hypothetical protein
LQYTLEKLDTPIRDERLIVVSITNTQEGIIKQLKKKIKALSYGQLERSMDESFSLLYNLFIHTNTVLKIDYVITVGPGVFMQLLNSKEAIVNLASEVLADANIGYEKNGTVKMVNVVSRGNVIGYTLGIAAAMSDNLVATSVGLPEDDYVRLVRSMVQIRLEELGDNDI